MDSALKIGSAQGPSFLDNQNNCKCIQLDFHFNLYVDSRQDLKKYASNSQKIMKKDCKQYVRDIIVLPTIICMMHVVLQLCSLYVKHVFFIIII